MSDELAIKYIDRHVGIGRAGGHRGGKRFIAGVKISLNGIGGFRCKTDIDLLFCAVHRNKLVILPRRTDGDANARRGRVAGGGDFADIKQCAGAG